MMAPEGCLSFPDIFGEVERQAKMSEVTARMSAGESYSFKAGGLLRPCRPARGGSSQWHFVR
jgi:peptide deformylase